MTFQAFRLRQDLHDFLANVVLLEVSERASEAFHAALDQVKEAAGLTFDQYCELEAAGLAAMGDMADVAFVAGLQAGRDPLSFLLESVVEEGGAL